MIQPPAESLRASIISRISPRWRCTLAPIANNWNVVQYSVLTIMMAQVSGLVPGQLIHVIADAHIYDRHVDTVRRILENPSLPAPTFHIDPTVKDFYAFTRDSFSMENYRYNEFSEKIPVAI